MLLLLLSWSLYHHYP